MDPEPPVGIACSTCPRVFSSNSALNKHRAKGRCNGLLRLQCGTCRKVFDTKQEKYRHGLLRNCTLSENEELAEGPPANDPAAVPPAVDSPAVDLPGVDSPTVDLPSVDPPVVDPPVVDSAPSTSRGTQNVNVANNINNGTIVNGTQNAGAINNGTINNVVINLGTPPPGVNDFMNTNTQVVIDSISRNPAFMQLAHEKNALPEAVLAETHFHGALENRNVFSADKHGPYAVILDCNRKLAISKKLAAEESIRNVNTIVNSPEVKPFFTDDLTKPVLPVPRTRSEARELRIRHTRLFYNKGYYVGCDLIKAPQGTPVFVAQDLLVDMLLEAVDDQDSPYRHDIDIYQEFALAACAHFVFDESTGKWFKGLPNGWEVCRDIARVESEIHIVLNDLKNEAKEKAAHDAKLRMGVDYFPDRLVAAAAIGWVVTASALLPAEANAGDASNHNGPPPS